MAQRIAVNIEEVEKHYRIEEDGAVWSHKLGRYLHPTKCGGYYSYYYVSLKDAHMGWISVHKLVASKYLGLCPAGMEISHKDGNKWNNHYTNLEYLTHSDNIRKSYQEHGRDTPVGNHLPLSIEHKMKLSQAKLKPVYCSDGRSWPSVAECARAIGKRRESIWLFIKLGKELKGVGGVLSFCSPAPTL